MSLENRNAVATRHSVAPKPYPRGTSAAQPK